MPWFTKCGKLCSDPWPGFDWCEAGHPRFAAVCRGLAWLPAVDWQVGETAGPGRRERNATRNMLQVNGRFQISDFEGANSQHQGRHDRTTGPQDHTVRGDV